MQPLWKICATVGGIFLVAAILFPLFQPVNVPIAHRAACESNMAQLGLAMLQYTQDSDGTLPPLINLANKQMWRETLYPYVKSVGVYRCPDNSFGVGSDNPQCLSWSYAANHAGWSKVEPQNQVIRLVDERGNDGPEWNMTSPAFLPDTGGELYTHSPPRYFFQHPSGTLNVLFADGHVKAMKPMETLTPTNLWTPGNAPFTGQDLANAQAILRHAEGE